MIPESQTQQGDYIKETLKNGSRKNLIPGRTSDKKFGEKYEMLGPGKGNRPEMATGPKSKKRWNGVGYYDPKSGIGDGTWQPRLQCSEELFRYMPFTLPEKSI